MTPSECLETISGPLWKLWKTTYNEIQKFQENLYSLMWSNKTLLEGLLGMLSPYLAFAPSWGFGHILPSTPNGFPPVFNRTPSFRIKLGSQISENVRP
mgnify:CR=1 FL=1